MVFAFKEKSIKAKFCPLHMKIRCNDYYFLQIIQVWSVNHQKRLIEILNCCFSFILFDNMFRKIEWIILFCQWVSLIKFHKNHLSFWNMFFFLISDSKLNIWYIWTWGNNIGILYILMLLFKDTIGKINSFMHPLMRLACGKKTLTK